MGCLQQQNRLVYLEVFDHKMLIIALNVSRIASGIASCCGFFSLFISYMVSTNVTKLDNDCRLT